VPQVQTLTGPVDTAALGQVLMHEHVFVLTPDMQQNYPEEWGSEEERATSTGSTRS
jgi:phosphotriesterase-related protein